MMFRVYGVTSETARAAADEAFKRLPIIEQKKFTPATAEEWLDSKPSELFASMKPVAIGKPLDAPEFAQQLIELAQKTTKCRGMQIRINAPQFDNKGGLILNKRTKKPAMGWEPYDISKDYVGMFQKAEAAREKAIQEAEAA